VSEVKKIVLQVATSSCNRKAVVEIMDTEVRNEESSNLSWLL